MTNPVLNNNIATDSVILWQYDKAYNLIRLIQSWNAFAKVSCTDFWNYFGNSIFPIDRADTFGLNAWGNMLGIPRPTINIPVGLDGGSDAVTNGYDENGYMVLSVEDGWKVVTIKNTLYRGLLKGRFFMMCHSPTVPNYNKYLAIVFGAFDAERQGDISYDIFDEYGNVKTYTDSDSSDAMDIPARYVSRNRALDFQNMTMGFTFPDSASVEEAYLIFQHYDIVYPFPAGIRYPGEFIYDDLVIGLNENQDEGQNYKNFVDGLVLAEEPNPSNPNGGIFSETDRANYDVRARANGKAHVCYIPNGTMVTISITPADALANGQRIPIWVDWGNGDAGYRYVITGNTSSYQIDSKEYQEDGIYAIIVFYKDNEVTSVNISAGTESEIEEYQLCPA